tara:strand:- start:73 stop:849 length:777 start_codon:yes stop_codon:yes gene_type:complete
MTSSFRVLPDFFVIGVVRSGTTSLFHYLGQHPNIENASYDELGYFDDNYHLGENWYKSLFPTKSTKRKIQNKHGKFLTFDDTPFYVYNPLVIKRILSDFPNSKIIVSLRNPIDRAFSNYNLLVNPEYTFEETIDLEINEIKNLNVELNDDSYLVDEFYEKILTRGFYAKQLKLWYDSFPKNQILVISSEELASNTNNVLNDIFNFLEISNFQINDLTKQNVRKFPPMNKETRLRLIEFFKPYNQELYNLVNRNFNWDV